MKPAEPPHPTLYSKSGKLRRLVTACLLAAGASLAQAYQGMLTPKLHVEGRFLTDSTGRHINLHGYMQPAASWFNGKGRNFVDPSDFTSADKVAGLMKHINAVSDIMSDPAPRFGKPHGWQCTFVRFIGDDGGVSNFAPGWDVTGALAKPAQFNGWIENVLVPYIDHCRSVGLYVVICGNPSVAYPGGDVNKNMTKQYQDNLITFWKAVASHPSIKAADNVMFEICNEPIAIESKFGANDWGSGRDIYWAALTTFMQPVVDAIRATGADNVIWLPGLGWQGEYQGFPAHPLTGSNLGYAAHMYPAYGNVHDNVSAVSRQWASNYKAAADQLPMLMTELMWTPNNGVGYQDLWNATTEGFGLAIKGCLDAQGNVSYLLGMTGDVLGNLNAGLNNITYPTEEGAQAGFAWWPTYSETNPPLKQAAPLAASLLCNISTRSNVGIDAHMQFAGFVITGTKAKRVLIRAAGPALEPFGITEALKDPVLTVYDSNHTVIGTNDNWDFATIQPTASKAGAFSWTQGSKDAALVMTLPPGLYSAQVSSKDGTPGVGIVEIYNADETTTDSNFVNISTRSDTLTGIKIQTAGFIIQGEAPKKLLIRASGPSIGALGVADAVADPVLTLFDSTGTPINRNDDWNYDSLQPTASGLGAFDFIKGSKDAGMIVTLPPGSYTAQVTAKQAAAGITLVEVYAIP